MSAKFLLISLHYISLFSNLFARPGYKTTHTRKGGVSECIPKICCGKSHPNLYQTIRLSGFYHHTKFERNRSVNVQMQANLDVRGFFRMFVCAFVCLLCFAVVFRLLPLFVCLSACFRKSFKMDSLSDEIKQM